MIKKRNKGFTLIELLVVIAIIALLSTTVMTSLSAARQKSRNAKRMADMKAIQTALEMYYNDNNGYPNPGGGWRSECNSYGGFAANNVIPGLTPTYLGTFPSDPSMNRTGSVSCYLYNSNGTDYALLDHNGPDIVYTSNSTLIDPTRDGGSNPCIIDGTNIWSWKISSSPVSRCW
ncbi:MAG: type II secretion system protein [Candidatus Parcubacteria bacterium]|nr:type II secretion system protein [Candidatus Parcubacteria bacterium]